MWASILRNLFLTVPVLSSWSSVQAFMWLSGKKLEYYIYKYALYDDHLKKESLYFIGLRSESRHDDVYYSVIIQ